MNNLVKKILLGTALLVSHTVLADLSIVPLPQDFTTRMTVEKKYPMVIDGFTNLSDEQVSQFYHTKLGDPIKITTDIGRFTLFYDVAGHEVKISVYPQNMKTQISAMVGAAG